MANTRPQLVHSPKQQLIGFGLVLFVVIILIAVGAAYGIIKMQQGVDQLYVTVDDDALGASPAGSGPGAIIVGNRAHGRELFNMSCYVCHGPTGSGIPGLGANLRQSRFIRTRSDPQLITFIKMGRQPGDPNTLFNGTMPPKGGNPALDDASLQDVVAFLRSLQRGPTPSALATSGDSGTSSASTLR